MKAFTNANAARRPARGRRWSQDARKDGQTVVVRRRRQRSARHGEGAARHARRARQPEGDQGAGSGEAGAGGGVTIGGLIDARRAQPRTPLIREQLRGAGRGGRRASRRRRFATSARSPATSASGRGAGTTATASRAARTAATTCFSFAGENQFHAIFGGGPSYIVHPSDTAPALVALDATFRIVGPSGERRVPAAEFFTLPTVRTRRARTCWRRRNAGVDAAAGGAAPARAARITRCSTAKPGRTRSSARRSCSRWTSDVCRRARVVLGGVAPIPWRLPEVEKMLAGQRVTPELAAKAGEAAVSGARPLAKNAYKVPMVRAMVARTRL